MPADPLTRILEAYPVVHQACRRRAAPGPSAARPVSPAQAVVLAHLERTAPCTMTELAARLGVALPTMSLTITRLVQAGLVRRDRDAADRRRVVLRLTPAGDRARRTQSLLDPARVRAVLALLTADERARGAAGLATLARAARQLARSDTATAGVGP